MSVYYYGITDFQYIAAGAAILASGGGGSYNDAVNVLEELADSGWSDTVLVQNYDGKTNCAVLALMGSPDVADTMTLADVTYSIANTSNTYQSSTGFTLGCVIPVEIGPINSEVATQITDITGRSATAIVTNFYITSVTQSTTNASLDTGIIQLDNTPDPANSTATCTIYNLNENLIMYSSLSNVPDIIAPDSICYYSESTGLGFSNATDDLAVYFDANTGLSTGKTVSIIKINAASALYNTLGVVASFATLLRNIGYAGALPYPA